jgi:hypothetical protein
MGYTHYWQVRASTTSDALEVARGDMERVVAAAQALGVPIAGPTGESGTSPGAYEGRWGFTGVGVDAYEALLWPPDPTHGADEEGFLFEFCKTNWRPYDAAVVACLLAAKERLGGDMRVGSDAEEEEAWEPARELFRATFGRDPSLAWPGDMEIDA